MSHNNKNWRQSTLNLDFPKTSQFSSFYPGPNLEVTRQLLSWFAQPQHSYAIFLWGTSGTGKTHLSQALCHYARQSDRSAVYLPMKELLPMPENWWEGLETAKLIVFDDVDLLLGQRNLEEGLLYLYERHAANEGYLLCTASKAPQQLSCCLADLHSRLSMSVIYHLERLNDEELVQALLIQAEQNAWSLTCDIAQYLVNHLPRDMSKLMRVLNQLGQYAMEKKRKVTLPFVRAMLNEMEMD